MEPLFEKYQNIQLFCREYRHYEIEGAFLTFAEFKNHMLTESMIMHTCKDAAQNTIILYLFMPESRYIKMTPHFKKLLDKHKKKEKLTIICFTKDELSIYVKKAILQYPHLKIYNYLYKHFSIELNRGPLCSRHTILTDEEVRVLCTHLMTHPYKLPSISINDPQVIWIGGEVGNVIKIESVSDITGSAIRYRIITPLTGKQALISPATVKARPVKSEVAPAGIKNPLFDDDAGVMSDNDADESASSSEDAVSEDEKSYSEEESEVESDG